MNNKKKTEKTCSFFPARPEGTDDRGADAEDVGATAGKRACQVRGHACPIAAGDPVVRRRLARVADATTTRQDRVQDAGEQAPRAGCRVVDRAKAT